MFSFLLKKILQAFVLLVVVIVLNFFLLRLAPGDVAQVIAGDMGGATEETLREIRAAYGLDRSPFEQLGIYSVKLLGFDLGHSFLYNLPVLDLILERVPYTLLLVVSALVFAVAAGTVLGVVAARKREGSLNFLITLFSVSGYSIPVFWLGMILLVLFAYLIPIFPTGGVSDPLADVGFWGYLSGVARHLVLPAFTLSFVYLAGYSLTSRATMVEALASDYVRTARTKGLSENRIVFKHALRNAVSPVVTLAGLQLSQVFAGAILVETVFNWPGLGRLSFEAIVGRDYPTILGVQFFSVLIVVSANLLTDLCHRLLDPRLAGHGS